MILLWKKKRFSFLFILLIRYEYFLRLVPRSTKHRILRRHKMNLLLLLYIKYIDLWCFCSKCYVKNISLKWRRLLCLFVKGKRRRSSEIERNLFQWFSIIIKWACIGLKETDRKENANFSAFNYKWLRFVEMRNSHKPRWATSCKCVSLHTFHPLISFRVLSLLS
jgi:hypothetical protein